MGQLNGLLKKKRCFPNRFFSISYFLNYIRLIRYRLFSTGRENDVAILDNSIDFIVDKKVYDLISVSDLVLKIFALVSVNLFFQEGSKKGSILCELRNKNSIGFDPTQEATVKLWSGVLSKMAYSDKLTWKTCFPTINTYRDL